MDVVERVREILEEALYYGDRPIAFYVSEALRLLEDYAERR